MAKSISAEDYRLRNSFEAMRRQLLDERYADRLERSLSYWALDADRRGVSGLRARAPPDPTALVRAAASGPRRRAWSPSP